MCDLCRHRYDPNRSGEPEHRTVLRCREGKDDRGVRLEWHWVCRTCGQQQAEPIPAAPGLDAYSEARRLGIEHERYPNGLPDLVELTDELLEQVLQQWRGGSS